MADSHGADGGHSDHGNLFKIYMFVAVALAICTGLSFAFNSMARSGTISVYASFALILTVAIIKAVLVGVVFMHLKWDWKLLYFLIIPVFIMGTMMAIVLLPDILYGPNKDMKEAFDIAELEQNRRVEK